MQDRFNFRVWNKLSNTMTYNFMFGNFMQKSLEDYEKKDWVGLNYEPDYICFNNKGIEDNLVIMQCTSLKDKNGKLIYEGDIVEAKHKPDREGWYCVYRGIVKYDNKNCQYVINSNHHKVLNENKLIKSDLNTDTSFNWFDWFEVIGNIYENPELLEVEE